MDEVEEVDATDLSSMNPLVTAGCVDPPSTDRTENRCSLFEANNPHTRIQVSPEKSNDDTGALTRSHKQIKLNNPYDV